MPQSEEILPQPSGEYCVGFIDLEILKPPSCSSGSEGVLVRLYYPTTQDFSTESRSNWIPSSEYFPGYGYFLRIPSLLFTPLSRYFLGGVKLWAMEDAPPLKDGNRSASPLVIFSHGLGGIRTTYSTMCCELASQGYYIAAIEHRDGSASMTLLPGKQIRVYEMIEKNSPGEFEKRQRQLRYRTEEVQLLYQFLKNHFNLNESEECRLIVRDSSREILDSLRGKFKIDNLAIMGHSFGAATAMNFALENPHLPGISIIALDPWLFALPEPPDNPPSKSIRTSLVVIDMEEFQSSENLLSLQHHLKYFGSTEFYTVRRGCHKQCSDIPLFKLGGYFTLNNKSPPTREVLHCLNQVILSFLLDGSGVIPPDVIELFSDLVIKN